MPNLLGPRRALLGSTAVLPVAQANFATALNDFTTTSQTSGYPTDWTTLASTSTMPPGGSISRAGNAMLYDSTGKLTYAPNNLVLYSQDFSQSNWDKTAYPVTITGGQSDPFNGTSATQLKPTTANDLHLAFQGVSVVASTKYIISGYFKANGYSQIRLGNVSDSQGVDVDLSAVTATAWGTGSSPTITPVAGAAGWYRVSAVFTQATTASKNMAIYIKNNSGSLSYAGDGTSAILAYGIQLEAVTYQTTPSTYNATTTSAYYGPRFDYDPVTLQPKGLLVEGTRTNRCSYSQDIANSSGWAAYGTGTCTPISSPNPSGVNSSYQIDMPAANTGWHTLNVPVTIGTTHTLSLWIKADAAGTIRFFDGNGILVGADATINVTTSWQRFSITGTASVTNDCQLGVYRNSAGQLSKVYIWGGQIELGGFATSYIPVPAASTAPTNTRSPDAFTLTGYANRLVEAYYIDEQTGANFSGNSTVVASGDTTISPPTFGWVTSLRAYTNAYATSPTAATNVAVTRAGGTAGQVPMLYDSTGTLTYAPNNLVRWSQDFRDTAAAGSSRPWGWGGSTTVTSNVSGVPAPDGTETASRVSGFSTSDGDIGLSQSVTVSPVKLIGSIYVRGEGSDIGKKVLLRTKRIGGTLVTTDAEITLTAGWQRLSVNHTMLSDNTGVQLILSGAAASNQASSCLVWGAQLEVVTYQTRPSGQYYNNYPTPNTTSAYIGPRYDYNPSTVPATALGLLVEGTRTNLLTYSAGFGSGWTGVGTPSATTTNTAPDGTASAYSWAYNAGNTGYYQVSVAVAANTLYTISAYVKYISGTAPLVRIGGLNSVWGGGTATNNAWVDFNPQTNAFSGVQTGVLSYGYQDAGNGWKRVWLTASTSSSTTSTSFHVYVVAAGTLAVWGNQVEAASFATSYIPTVASTIDRATETLTFANNTNRLVDSFFIDEATGGSYSQNTNASSTSPLSLTAPTFGWSTSLRSYTNAYAGSISTPSWLSFSGTTGTTAGNRTYYDSTGTLTWAPANLLTFSNTFTSWTASTYATVAATAVVNDPFGGTSAYKLYENATAAGVHSISAASVSIGTSGRALFSVYVKAAERTQVCIQYNDASVNYYPVFNIPASSGGAVTVATSNGVGSNWSYQDAGNGWYRISIWTNSAAEPAFCIIYTGNANTFSYAGTVNSGIFIYGAQLEKATYATAPSAYIPTTSAAVYGPRYDYDPRTYFGFTATIANATPNSTFVVPTTFGDGSAASGVENYYVGQTALINGVSYPVTAYAASSRTVTITGLPAPVSQSILLGNPEWQKPRGLLIEEQRANLLTYSEQFENAAWTAGFSGLLAFGSGSVANATVAPDGTSNADKIVEDTTPAASHRFFNNIAVTVTSGASVAYSIYVKAAGRTFVRIADNNLVGVTFDLTNGSTSSVSGAVTTSSAQNVGNGWWRLSFAAPSTASASGRLILYLVSGGTTTYTGDGVSGVFVWGAQLENSASFPTSYIPSITGATRAPDVAQLTGSALTTLQGANWTFMGEVGRIPSASVTAGVIGANSFGVNAVRFNGSTIDLVTWQNNGSTYSFVTPVSALTNNTRIGLSGNASGTSSVASSGTVVSGGTVSWAVGAYLGYGASAGGSPLNSTYRSLALYNQRLPDAILKQKSSVGAPY